MGDISQEPALHIEQPLQTLQSFIEGQDHQVRVNCLTGQCQAFDTVDRCFNPVTLVGQASSQELQDSLLVLYDQNPLA